MITSGVSCSTLCALALMALSVLDVAVARPDPHGVILADRNMSTPSTAPAAGARQGRQDVRMLAANATGTSADQALAAGTVPSAAPAASSSSPASPAAPSSSSTPHVESRVQVGRRVSHPGHPAENSGEDSNIVFPTAPPKTDLSQGPSNLFDPVGTRLSPSCANGSTFCDHIDDYPAEHLQNILPEAFDKYRDDFGRDVVHRNDPNLTQRIDVSDEYPMCAYVENIVYPKVARTKEEKWLYIVNTDHMVQGVHIESCVNEGQTCSLADNFPYGFTTSCRQKFITRKLVAINPSSGQPEKDEFVLPSCCSCRVQRSAIANRITQAKQAPQTPAVTAKKTSRRRRRSIH